MSIDATVYAVSQTSYGAAWGDRFRPAWRVTVAVDRPTSWAPRGQLAFLLVDTGDAQPLAPGDRVTVPVMVSDGHVVAHRPAGDVRLRMLGTVDDPDAPLH